MLYTLPCAIAICAEGFNSMSLFSHLKSYKKKLTVIAVCILFLFCGLYSFPLKREEIKNCLKYINKNIKEGEKIYIYWDAMLVFQYYADIEYVDIEFIKHTQVIYDNSWDSGKYVNGLKELKGRYWLLFFSWIETDIINQINSFGYEKIREFRKNDSSTYLYDLNQ
jgi:hypothetical protein